MTLAKGMQANLFASEETFPELINPVQMSFDMQGRLWVATWPTYPHWKPKEEMNDKLLIVIDKDGDGKADEIKTFADKLHNPTGFEFWGGGVLVAMAPDLLFLKDTDGDDRADVRMRVLSGLDTADTHHAANSFTLDPMGSLYMQEGTFHHTQVETPYGPPQRCANAGVFRYEPRTQNFEVYVSHPFANPHGHVFDKWGQDFVFDGTGSQPYHAVLFSGRIDFPQKHATPPQVYGQRTRPCPGVEILSSRHFPEELQGNLLVGNVIGFQGILQYKLADAEGSFAGTEVEPIISSSDPNFRPADLEMGPDGAIWFVDWHNPIIGHMQHNLRDPNRDRVHGRIYRVTYPSRPLLKPKAIAGVPTSELLDLLKEPEDRTRYRTRIELSGRPTKEVVEAVDGWIAGLDPSSAEYEHLVLEGLWVKAHHNVVDVELLERVLGFKDFRARAAATRVLCLWRDRVPSALARLQKLARDESPRVRLEVVRAASYFRQPEAIGVAMISATMPSSPYMEYLRNETLKALEPQLKEALAKGIDIAPENESSMRLMFRNVSTADLLAAKPSRAVYREVLERRGISEELRKRAIDGLASMEKKSTLAVLLDALRSLGEVGSERDESVLFDLGRLLTNVDAKTLAGQRAGLVSLAESAGVALIRQTAMAALITADGSIESAWKMGLRSSSALRDVVSSTPFVKDLALRSELFTRIEPLLTSLPADLSAEGGVAGTRGRYVRIELPRSGTLSLAEVEVFSSEENVARRGEATQKDTAFGGSPGKAIDGNPRGAYSAGSVTHTSENTKDPWWEVDLGEERGIERIVIHNRTDSKAGSRLNGYTLIVLDQKRQEVVRREGQPAPAPKAEFAFEGGDAKEVIRRSAIAALASVPGRESAAFKAILPFVSSPSDRASAIRGLLAISEKGWPKEDAPGLSSTLVAYLNELPTEERTSPTALDALQLGQSLASLLPTDDGRKLRGQLRELGVNMIRIGTVTDRMLYDKDVIAVEAGKPMEILFENTDIMPHNLVIGQPGSLEEVGLASEAMATDPSALERHYVPGSPKILASSRLLQPRALQRIPMTAPAKPGIYPYVCTYPGHWRRMYGAMYVVEKLEDYLADPSAYLASHPMTPADDLLKLSRPRQEWKLEELLPAVKEIGKGRSFASGKQVFQIANCIACHRMNGVGYEIGPDLAKLDAKQTPADILKSLIQPSDVINEKYATQVLELESGTVVTGVVVEESATSVTVVENPLAKSEPKVIAKSEIAERVKSKTSIMPLGMLDRLTREEILDLLAYLVARGNAEDPIFEGGHGHGH
jgi:putative heme-binding domain-containing protein